MELLEKKILECGEVIGTDILKVDSFLNHQIDPETIEACGAEWVRLYKDEKITKILTMEASGIAIGYEVARQMKLPVVFAKKSKSRNVPGDVYTTKVVSFTYNKEYDIMVSKKFLGKDDKVLIIDDFLANGAALCGLIGVCRQAGAEIVGAGVAIEKAFEPGGKMIRDMGIRVESLARVASMDESAGITFVQ